MQKHKHRPNSKTKENPSPASGLQGEAMGSLAWRPAGGDEGDRWGGRGWRRWGGRGDKAGVQRRGTESVVPSPGFVNQGTGGSPGLVQMTLHPVGVLPGTRRPGTASLAAAYSASPSTPRYSHRSLTPLKRSAPHQQPRIPPAPHIQKMHRCRMSARPQPATRACSKQEVLCAEYE